MTVLFVLVVPLALALFIFGMEKMEAVVFRPRPAATPEVEHVSATAESEADSDDSDGADDAASAPDSGSSPTDKNDD